MSTGQFAKELLASAADAGVQAFESDERILSYPVILQVSPADAPRDASRVMPLASDAANRAANWPVAARLLL